MTTLKIKTFLMLASMAVIIFALGYYEGARAAAEAVTR